MTPKTSGLVLVLSTIAVVVACEQKGADDRSAETAREQAVAADREHAKPMIEKNNAVTSWREALRREALPRYQLYSFQLESVLIRPDGRPLATVGRVED